MRAPISGEIWLHKEKLTKYTVLCVSNIYAEKSQWKITVVYMDESDTIWSRPVVEWYDRYSYVGMGKLPENHTIESSKKISTLEKMVVRKDQLIAKIQKQASKESAQSSCTIANLNDRISVMEKELNPLRESLNSLTAERGKWLRKLRREGVDV